VGEKVLCVRLVNVVAGVTGALSDPDQADLVQMVRILSWNILHGGGSRVTDIVRVIERYNADLVTLQEYRHGKNHPLFLRALDDLGYHSVIAPPTSNARENSVLLAGRFDVSGEAFPQNSASPHRAIKAEVLISDDCSLNLVCVHFPHKKAQIPLFEALLNLPDNWSDGLSALVGDFNCGIPFVDSETKSFYATHMFQQLLREGWIDAWRSRNGDKKEFTWFSTQRSNGFRYDHALLSMALDRTVAKIRYDHDVRVDKLSDHSLMVIDLDV
jgi:exonuclease III